MSTPGPTPLVLARQAPSTTPAHGLGAVRLSLGLLASLAAVGACDSSKTETQHPDGDAIASSTELDADSGPRVVDLSSVPQQQAPPEYAIAYENYLRGRYSTVEDELTALVSALEQPKDDEFRRASLVKSLWALAVAEVLPENAMATADLALDHARAIKDPDAEQLARIARASYLLGMSEVTPAQAELVRALGLEGAHRQLANVFLAKVLINQAFGPDERLTRPRKLDEAETTYRAVLAEDPGLLRGHIHEGLAAIGKYRGDREATCMHAAQAYEAYSADGMSDYLLEGPTLLQGEARCTP